LIQELSAFVFISIPAMILLGMRHALDADHIAAIDNIVRLQNASKKSRWVGAGFSAGHMISVLVEMMLLIFIVGSVTGADGLTIWGGTIGAVALGSIGAINLYAMKKWGKTGSAILASKTHTKTGSHNPFTSSLITGMVFGLGFDTATQISALTLSVVTSATLGVQVSLTLSAFFAIGMISLDTLDSILLRSAFSRMFTKGGFRSMSYALSGAALAVAAAEIYKNFTGTQVMPDMMGPVLAGAIVSISFAYALTKRSADDKVVSANKVDSSNHKNRQ